MPGEKNFFQTFGEAFAKGDIFTKVSFLVWGLGYIGHGQLMKALLVTLVEGLGLYFLALYGAPLNSARWALSKWRWCSTLRR